ncbi:hypothetical protein HMPREF0645_2790 [Hallella bergensis DSM 17361]|uniref:Uncharacterized protein n=1 Tax=Hallella bergensis DSM 17361 TaxID=585502 RepID=D1Q0Q5_9BACT|nr:hypothetical protein HMPREF0645_2790 [Hallella bergensis DSM 17361]
MLISGCGLHRQQFHDVDYLLSFCIATHDLGHCLGDVNHEIFCQYSQ